MNKWIKRSGFGVLGLIGLGVGALLLGAQLGERKMQRRIEVKVEPVALRSDAASIERGRYLYLSRGCTECHAVDGGGKDVINDGNGFLVHAPNITPAAGSVVAAYTASDWTRTIRHGVKPDGRPAIVMPSEDYARFTDDDLAAVVAYLRQMPAATGGGAKIEFPLPVKAFYGLRPGAGRGREDRPHAASVTPGARSGHGRTRRLCRQQLHRLPRRRPVWRQGAGRPARLAGGGEPDPGRRLGDDALPDGRQLCRHAAQRQAPRRQRHQPGDALRFAEGVERHRREGRSTCT